MSSVFHESPSIPPPPLSSFSNKISPSILLIIVILAVIFFVSGLLHLLVRYLFRPANRQPDDADDATALQGQLQQLFHLHDSGVDQSFIDTLPVFLYKAIIGLKDPFDCAVCLCEFEPDDKLRLLPKCSHAFHLECIDTWLLSHSTCPLCRGALFPDYSPIHSCSPVVFVLESSSDSSREIGTDIAVAGAEEDHARIHDTSQKITEIAPKDVQEEEKVVPVILGKFRNVDAVELAEEGTSTLDQRRCFSMGSHEYVMDRNSLLQVAIKPSKKKPRTMKLHGHRLAMSECDFLSTREGFRGFDLTTSSGDARIATAKIEKKESFSVSKIWLQSRSDKPEDCSRRAFSFRLPLRPQSSDEAKANCSSSPRWDKGGSELDFDLETGSCNNSLAEEAPSFTRRTLLWIMGRQNKVVNHI